MPVDGCLRDGRRTLRSAGTPNEPIIYTAGSATVDEGITEAPEEARHHGVSHVSQTLQDLSQSGSIDLAILSVATRVIRALIEE